MKDFIDKLQKSDEATKRKWLIFLSALSMVVVFIFWIVYLNLTVPKIGSPEETAKIEEKAGFFEIMKAGLKSAAAEIKHRTINAFDYFFVIKKPKQNFILEE